MESKCTWSTMRCFTMKAPVCLCLLLLLSLSASSIADRWTRKLAPTQSRTTMLNSYHLLSKRKSDTDSFGEGIPRCRDPGTPDHGTRVGSLQVGSTLFFACDSGFLLRGAEVLACRYGKNNKVVWDADLPQCVPRLPNADLGSTDPCGPPPKPTTFAFAISYSPGESVRHSCLDGYVPLLGNQELACSDGQWEEEPLECRRIARCRDYGNIGNGRRILTAGTQENNTVRFTCNDGFLLLGNRQVRCRMNDYWSGPWPMCAPVRINCGDPGSIVNGRRFVGGTTEGSLVRFLCNSGYVLSGEDRRECLSTGEWSGSVPTCQRVRCSSPPQPSAGFVSYTSTEYGAKAAYSCNQGHVLTGHTDTACVASGTWSNSPPKCTRVECGVPRGLYNGQVRFRNTMYGNTAEYSCARGYGLVGYPVRTCQADGIWSGSTPSCNSDMCGTLSDPENGKVTINHMTLGGKAVYSCDSGYQLSSPWADQRTCGFFGVWSGEAPTCEAITCPRLRTFGPVSIAMSSENLFNSVATYTCDIGYAMFGGHTSLSRRCQENGRWTGGAAFCFKVKCSRLSNPHNGQVAMTGRGLGDEATYTCDPSYILLFGDQIRTCKKTGWWSGTEPCCIRNKVFCKELSSPSTSTVVLTGVQVGDKAEYSCNEGLDHVSGDLTRTCQSSGMWSGEEPICAVTCPQLSDPDNGKVMVEGNRPGDKAMYECDSGFIIAENDSCRVCQDNGEWSGAPPTCSQPLTPPSCGNLTNPANGIVDLSQGNGKGSVATYSCNEGFLLNGVSNRTCGLEEDGVWSGSEPTCQSVDCGSLTPPTNGEIDVNMTTLGSIALYECDLGYELNGPARRECLSNGSWSETDPICQLVDCGGLESPLNGNVVVSGTTFSSQANYTCDANHDLVGPDNRECLDNGEWSDMAPTCQPIQCPELTNPANGVVNVTDRIVGSQASYSCSFGYRLIGAMTTECLESEMWSNNPPVCQLITCPPLPQIDLGMVEILDNTVGGEAVYRCDGNGLAINGTSTRICGIDGEWSGEEPFCEVVLCPVLSDPDNGLVVTNSQTVGSSAVYFCDDGFIIAPGGLIARLCGDDGDWVGEAPTCVRENCEESELVDPTNGMVSFNTTSLNSLATYTCVLGYRLVGDTTRVCMVIAGESRWSGSTPECIIIMCPPLEDPVNGMVTVTGQFFGGGAVYDCMSGFQPVGLLIRMCRQNGQWDGEQPTCQPDPGTMVCPTLSDPPNGQVQIVSTTIGSVISYSCNSDYRLNGNETRECLQDRTWSGSEPTCTLIDCGFLEDPANGSVVTLQGTTVNRIAQYFCATGFSLFGFRFRVCQNTSMWSGVAPECQFIDCGPLSSPENGQVATPQGTTFDQEAVYSCIVGYELNGNSTRVCTEGGWSGTEPLCSVIGNVTDSCGDPGTPENGARMIHSSVVGSTVDYTCEEGYRLVGNASRVCMSNLQWSGALPTCELILCPLLADPPNGFITGNGQTVGSLVGYFCNNGYRLRSTDILVRRCFPSGQWSGEEPMCIPDLCNNLMDIVNGSVTINSTAVGGVAEYSCNLGFELNGPATRTCQRGGVWSEFEPECIRMQCADRGAPQNGRTVMIDAMAQPGSRLYFVCDDGFQPQGSAVLQCMEDGNWSSPVPVCRPSISGNQNGPPTRAPCRQRQDWTTLNQTEKQLYIDAVKTVATDPTYQPLYNELVSRYEDSFNTIAQHTMPSNSQFFPWHRYFLMEYENLLRMIDLSITIPYWDWSLYPTMPYSSSVFDPDTGFGNSTAAKSMCVTSGPFREGEFVVTNGTSCLRREYKNLDFPGRRFIEEEFLSLPASKFSEFHNSIQLLVHLMIRCDVGGHMCSPQAANDPLYPLLLSSVDLLLDQWQKMDDLRANIRYAGETTPLVLAFDDSLVVADFSNNSALPYGVCAQYAPLQPVDEVSDTQTTIPSDGPDLPTITSSKDPTDTPEIEQKRHAAEIDCSSVSLADASAEEDRYLRDIVCDKK